MSTDEPMKLKKPPRKGVFEQIVESLWQRKQPIPSRSTTRKDSDRKAEAYEIDVPEPPSADEQLTAVLKTIAAVATAVWRAKSKLNAAADAALPDALRNVPRHIQSAWDALEAGNIQVDDPTGGRYEPGLAVNVLTSQPMDGITCDVIHETIKPSVYFNDVLIQRADVIIARPVGETSQDAVGTDANEEPQLGDHEAPEEKGMNADGPDND